MMNNILNKYTAGFVLIIIGLSACEKADPVITLDGEPGVVSSSEISLSESTVSFFDQDNITYDVFANIELVSSANISTPTSSKDVAIDSKKGTYTANFSDLGITKIQDTAKIKITPMVGSQDLTLVETEIIVVNPIEITAPAELIVTSERDTTLVYSVLSKQNPNVDILIERKLNFDGTYEVVESASSLVTAKMDSISFKASDFPRLDTLYHRVTASVDDLVASKEVKTFINTKYFGEIKTLSLFEDNEFYSLADLAVVEEKGAEISFMGDGDIFNLSIQSEVSSLSFVPFVSDDKRAFDFGDKLLAEEVFANGMKEKIIQPSKPGEQFVYQITRMNNKKKDIVYIGILRVESLGTSPNNNIVLSFREAVAETIE